MSEQFDASRPIYAQLVERLKARILAGTYPPGGHLDSVRDLAAAAGVNPNTMQRALAQLESEGLVTLRHGGYEFDRTTAGCRRP
jgi:GntR family transcriptional regulator